MTCARPRGGATSIPGASSPGRRAAAGLRRLPSLVSAPSGDEDNCSVHPSGLFVCVNGQIGRVSAAIGDSSGRTGEQRGRAPPRRGEEIPRRISAPLRTRGTRTLREWRKGRSRISRTRRHERVGEQSSPIAKRHRWKEESEQRTHRSERARTSNALRERWRPSRSTRPSGLWPNSDLLCCIRNGETESNHSLWHSRSSQRARRTASSDDQTRYKGE